MIYLILSALLAGSGYAIYRLIRSHAESKAEYEAAIDELQQLADDQSRELEQMQNVIHELEEVNREANREKRKLHNGNKRDNAESATRIMSKLAGDGSQNGDEATSSD